MYKTVKRLVLISVVLISLISLSNVLFAAVDEEAEDQKKSNAHMTEQELIDSLPKTKKDISGVVVDMISGEAIPGATVSLLKSSIVTDENGKFTIKDVNEFHAIQMTARITTELDIIIGCSYFFVPTTYYPISASKDGKLDVQIINLADDTSNVVLKINGYDANTIDKYCESCHESSPCLVSDDYGTLSESKKQLRGVMVRQSELEQYIEDMRKKDMTVARYSSIRFVDSHPKAIDITLTDSFYEERVIIPEDLPLRDEKIMICDTCHTRHVPTQWLGRILWWRQDSR